ncbi:hypothetical protein [Hymenobacter sp. YC55]|uniref:hypothetical protein n=1 Tax=Hymenobacter sp. YC55 TaxID=3034019 RepID=UPI0023F63F27|nr:hypothetical protein [Hymenobacter sp. YC55]
MKSSSGWSSEASIPEELYQRQILSAAGRDELLTRMRLGKLRIQEQDELTQTIEEESSNSPAAILAFCAEAFAAEFDYRTLDTEAMTVALASASDSTSDIKSSEAKTKYEQAQQRFKGDTAAFQQWYYEQLPARLKIEQAIAAEDSMLQMGWTIYPPLTQPALHHWIHEKRSVLGKTRTRTVQDLYELNLIDATAYKQLQSLLKQDRLPTEVQVCQKAAELALHHAKYAKNKAKQLRWLQRLQQAGLLSDSQHLRLLREYQPYQLKEPFELLAYCEHSQIIDLRHMSRKPQELYPILFAKLSTVLPNFHFTDLKVTVAVKDDHSDLLTQNVTISFWADGRLYENTFFQAYQRKDGTDPTSPLGAEVGEYFHQSINRWLADQNSLLRLYQAHTPDAQSIYGNERLGLIALTNEQRKLWGTKSYFLSSESHDNRFTSVNIEKLIIWYQKLGLLSHLSPTQLAEGRQEALRGEKTDFAQVLSCFPNVIYELDWESANPPYPYDRVTRRFAAISRGAFVPVDVQDGFGATYPEKERVSFGFQLRQQTYRTQLKVQSDWLDSEFFELIKRAMQEQYGNGNFYPCLAGEAYIFLTPQQYTDLQKAQPELFAVTSTDE